jgi:hypothetical protein
MYQFFFKTIFFFILTCFYFSNKLYAQNYIFSGKVVDAKTRVPLKNASIHLKGAAGGSISKEDGSFIFETTRWSDILEITSVGYNKLVFNLEKKNITWLLLELDVAEQALTEVIITSEKRDKEPGKRYMKKVIANKSFNNPDRFKSYSYEQYTRHELDLSNLDSNKNYGKGLKSLVINTYRNSDPGNANSTSLPLYFAETVSNKYHNVSPNIDRENILARKTLGLETDKILWRFDKFNFNFNIYDDWLFIFNKTFASPLSNTAFNYYNFYFSDSSEVDHKKVYKIHFSPKQKYENAFSGSLWINDSTYSIKKIQMHLSKTADLNFVNDIHYKEEYRLSLDSATNKYEYMPYKYSSVVDFETGWELLGIPIPNNSQTVRVVNINTTVIGKIKINSDAPDEAAIKKMKNEQTANYEKPDTYWEQNRLDTLSQHEKSIYSMANSLKNNHRYKWNSSLISFVGTGYWDFENKLCIGPWSSFLSSNMAEGLRFRTGLWTSPGFNKKLNLNSYVAYGSKDQKLKGGLGVKYIWNAAKWSKTSLFASSDFDFMIEQDDELDKDNLINSFFKKNIPTTRVYIKQISLKHEQYISKGFNGRGSLTYKELSPVFNFTYHPLNKKTRQPIDTIYKRVLTAAEMSVGFRYSKEDKTIILNYDQIYLKSNYFPIFTVKFTYGLAFEKAQFTYQKIDIGVEQQLRLPPKALLYYKVEAGKTFGIAPFLLLNVPHGNESYVASKYLFNTMLPYEYASDEYISLHTRFYLGGSVFNKIPYLRKLEWRERFSFNGYKGDMSRANMHYNRHCGFSVPNKEPFMEAGVGIENIFQIFSIDYYQRLSGRNKSHVPKGGIFVGVNLTF